MTSLMVGDPVLRITQIDIPIHDEYVVLNTTTTLAYFSIWTAAWIYVVRAVWTMFAVRRIYLLMLVIVGLHLVQLGYFFAVSVAWKLMTPLDSQLINFFFGYNLTGILFWLTVMALALVRIFRSVSLESNLPTVQ